MQSILLAYMWLPLQIKGQGEGSANERTRTTVTAGLKKKLKDQMGEFSQLRSRIQVGCASQRGAAETPHMHKQL
jgi:hypothetical protein